MLFNMEEKVTRFRVHPRFFVEDSEEAGVDTTKLRYGGRGEKRYGIGRQLVDRGCHDLMTGYRGNDARGLLLVERGAEPAKGYTWPFGGFINRGVPIVINGEVGSLASRVIEESNLVIDTESIVALGWRRFLWPTTPYAPVEVPSGMRELAYQNDLSKMSVNDLLTRAHERRIDTSKISVQSFADMVNERDLPGGIDDTGLLFYAEARGNVTLDSLHTKFKVVTPEMYTDDFRAGLHSYVRNGMDMSMELLNTDK